MANSIRKQLLNRLRDTVFPIITVANGYNNDIVTIERGLKNFASITDEKFPALFISSADENRENVTNKSFRSDLTAFITGYVISPNNLSGLQEALDDLIEDTTKAIHQDYTQGGLAVTTEITRIDTDAGDEQSHATFVMQVRFDYRTQGVNP